MEDLNANIKQNKNSFGDDLPNLLHKKQWILVLALGVFLIVFGTFIIAYSIIVVEHGLFQATAVGFSIPGYFFIGLGMGYIICSGIIRNLEKKIP